MSVLFLEVGFFYICLEMFLLSLKKNGLIKKIAWIERGLWELHTFTAELFNSERLYIHGERKLLLSIVWNSDDLG